jgi:proline dehydrogenase
MRGIAERSTLGRKLSSRFVAGTTIDDAIAATKAVNALGMHVTIDNLGENVTNVEEAHHSATLYSQMLDAITANRLDANISLKLTHMGFDVDQQLALDIVSSLVDKATRMTPTSFVRVDMEGSPYTQPTLDLVHELHRRPGHKGCVGTVIQAYLFRSEKDVEKLLADGIRIRLCKGAYKESAEIAFQKKSDVDANYVKLMKVLMKSGIFHGLATHDENIVRQAVAFARAEEISPAAFEFQMLHGIRRDLQQQLVRDGWGVRIYVPFGTEWYPYFMRRLGERPANVLFLLKNLLR